MSVACYLAMIGAGLYAVYFAAVHHPIDLVIIVPIVLLAVIVIRPSSFNDIT
jgi:hypothetical protein